MQFKQKVIVILLFSAIAFLTLVSTIAHLLTESWWFETIGLKTVFWQRITWQVVIWSIAFGVFVGFLGLNYWLALRLTGNRAFRFLESSVFEPDRKSVV